MAGSYLLAVGLPQNPECALGFGVCTRNLGAGFAPLFGARDEGPRR